MTEEVEEGGRKGVRPGPTIEAGVEQKLVVQLQHRSCLHLRSLVRYVIEGLYCLRSWLPAPHLLPRIIGPQAYFGCTFWSSECSPLRLREQPLGSGTVGRADYFESRDDESATGADSSRRAFHDDVSSYRRLPSPFSAAVVSWECCSTKPGNQSCLWHHLAKRTQRRSDSIRRVHSACRVCAFVLLAVRAPPVSCWRQRLCITVFRKTSPRVAGGPV